MSLYFDPIAPDEETVRALMAENESLQAAVADQKDRYLRLASDFDNFRKRTAQEYESRSAAQKEAFIRELLPVIDNLERALSSDATTEQLRNGVRITLQQLNQLLRAHGIEPQESLGLIFDPHRHEAIAARHEPTQPDHSILEVFQRGYHRGDDVFRPAKVIINDLSLPRGTNHGR